MTMMQPDESGPWQDTCECIPTILLRPQTYKHQYWYAFHKSKQQTFIICRYFFFKI